MAFVHSLVKMGTGADVGWCAPLELGEASPHYISFVIPVNDDQSFFEEYACELIVMEQGRKNIKVHELHRRGEDSFAVQLGGNEIWFAVRPSSKPLRRLPYVGKLGHEDFQYRFVEIEPDDPAALDKMFEQNGTFIIGCEPFTHYTRIGALLRMRASVEA